jgi:hypothetical protein
LETEIFTPGRVVNIEIEIGPKDVVSEVILEYFIDDIHEENEPTEEVVFLYDNQQQLWFSSILRESFIPSHMMHVSDVMQHKIMKHL